MKKNLYIILICVVAISTIIVIFKGFNVGLKYSENTTITINLKNDYNISDIRKITNEVFQKEKVIIQKVEFFKETVKITVKSVNDEQLENLNSKLNEKYGIENELSDIVVKENANTRLRTIVSPYIMPYCLSAALIFVYELIRFRKQEIKSLICKSISPIILTQIILACIYAICRIPVNEYTMIISLILYVISEIVTLTNLIKLNNKAQS